PLSDSSTCSYASSNLFFFCYCSAAHPDLHSFPTRRSSDLFTADEFAHFRADAANFSDGVHLRVAGARTVTAVVDDRLKSWVAEGDRKSTRLNSSHGSISYAVFCLKKKNGK